MLEMIIGIGLFTAIIIALVVIILAAKSQLVASGSVSVVVNDGRTVEAPVGSKLLAALADVNLFVASACGGKGTCGQCRVKIFEGGGTLLPSETSFITKREAADFDRLSCQVTRNLATSFSAASSSIARFAVIRDTANVVVSCCSVGICASNGIVPSRIAALRTEYNW